MVDHMERITNIGAFTRYSGGGISNSLTHTGEGGWAELSLITFRLWGTFLSFMDTCLKIVEEYLGRVIF